MSGGMAQSLHSDADCVAGCERGATVCNVARAFSSVGFCVLAVAATVCTACGSGAVQPPAKPEPVVEMREPHRAPREIPRLIAPPPAYGNKIVMAHADVNTITN